VRHHCKALFWNETASKPGPIREPRLAESWWKCPAAVDKAETASGSFDSVRLAPHYAQDDSLVKDDAQDDSLVEENVQGDSLWVAVWLGTAVCMEMVGPGGLEPLTSSVSRMRSNQLSYGPTKDSGSLYLRVAAGPDRQAAENARGKA
jgi:hypothetical protein